MKQDSNGHRESIIADSVETQQIYQVWKKISEDYKMSNVGRSLEINFSFQIWEKCLQIYNVSKYLLWYL